MALHRASVSGRRGSKNDSQKDEDEAENNGYIQVLVKPLEQGNFSLIFNWLGLTGTNVSGQQIGVVYGLALAFSSVIMYYIFKCDIGAAFHRLCGIVVPMFTIICSFCWLSLYLRKTWSTTSVYLLFSSCFLGETLAQVFVNTWNNHTPEERDESGKDIIAVSHVTQPIVVFIVLLAVCTSSIFSSLQTQNSAAVISLVSFTRFLACTTLGDLPQGVRPYMSYLCGLAGIIVSKYMEAVLKPPVNSFMTQDGKIPVYKRRRSSASGTHTFAAHKSNARRTSLPALIPKMQVS
ncbi:hypothetical protein FSP39_017374 [Pinctada imbricata]|uniref:Uncharacterized protein n=1 Tax=Pinctada imbricata TaxID=66713 RepID=A0AA88YFI7_PINIB|nr:hypothetical protein FSP39_017374 [Pinctada imbricata]